MTNAEIRAALDKAATYPGGRGTGANPTPQVRKVAEREAEQTQEQRTLAAMDARADMLAEPAERIDKLEARLDNHADNIDDIIEELHVANKHLAGRIDKVERELGELRDAAAKDITGLHNKTSDTLDILETVTDLGKDMGRDLDSLLAHHPQCQQPTIRQQCDESWTQETEEDEESE